MRKLIAALLVLWLCLGAALAEAADVTGVWYLDEIITGGVSLEPSAFDMELTLELRSDGSAWGRAMDTEENGSWVMNGAAVEITLDGQMERFTLAEGKLLGERDGMEIVLVRERAENTLPEVRTDATLSDFNGAWYATAVESMGMQFPVADMGMSMMITLADGVAIIAEGVEDDVTTTSGSATANGGMLIIALPDGTPLPLQLHVNGEMTYTATDDGVATIIHFEKMQ